MCTYILVYRNTYYVVIINMLHVFIRLWSIFIYIVNAIPAGVQPRCLSASVAMADSDYAINHVIHSLCLDVYVHYALRSGFFKVLIYMLA